VLFAPQASRKSAAGLGHQAFFDHDFVVPAIAEVIGVHRFCSRPAQHGELSGVNYFSRSTTTISPDDDNYKLADRVTVQAGCGRQLKKVFKILQLDLDIA
jgi:hypothetical protein